MRKLFSALPRRELLGLVIGVALTMTVFLYPSCEDISSDGDSITGSFEAENLPLLPNGFPLYPQAFTTSDLSNLDDYEDNAVDDIYDELVGPLEDFLFVDIPSYVENDVKSVIEWLVASRVPFFDPGPMSASVNAQIASLFKGAVTFEEASLNLGITNKTDDWWGVPVRFSLYVGRAEDVFSKSADARAGALVRTDETDGCDCTFELNPGETKNVQTENLTSLVSALNELNSLAIDYDTDIPAGEADWEGLIQAVMNKSPSSIGSWRLSIEEFELNISGEGSINIPDAVPDWVKELIDDNL